MTHPFQLPRKSSANVPNSTLLYIAYKNLMSKRLRSSLTILGIIIGIGAIFFLFSFALGLRSIVTNEIIGSATVNTIDIVSPNSQIVELDRPTIERIKKLAHVVQVGASHSLPGAVVYDGSEIDAVVYGIDSVYTQQLELPLTKGRQITDQDGKVVIINVATLNNMGITNDGTIVDKKIEITIPQENAEPIVDQYTVIGVADSGTGGEVYLPNFVFENAGITQYAEVKAVVDETDNVQQVRRQIESLGLETTSTADSLEQINQVFRFFNLILIGLGSIGMIVAVLGMFNTLTISLLERTKEIGLMVASGFRGADIRKLFIIESLVLSFTGAVVGMLLAWLMSQVLNQVMNTFAEDRGVTETFNLFSQPLWLIGAMLFFMFIVGFVVVYFPARRAEKINPIDALRRE